MDGVAVMGICSIKQLDNVKVSNLKHVLNCFSVKIFQKVKQLTDCVLLSANVYNNSVT